MNPPADDPPKRSGPAASAGIVLWRRVGGDRTTLDHEFEVGRDIEILLVHPGGPFWARKDEHAWSIPKGEFNPDDEDPRAAAQREFEEELGQPVPSGSAIELRPFQAGRKRLYPFAIEGDFDVDRLDPDDEHRSHVSLEWPPRSGTVIEFCEVDRAAWIHLADAPFKLHKGQAPLLTALRSLFPPLVP